MDIKEQLALERYRYLAQSVHRGGLIGEDSTWNNAEYQSDPRNVYGFMPPSVCPKVLNLGGSWKEAHILRDLGYDCTTITICGEESLRRFSNAGFKLLSVDMCEMDVIENESVDGVMSFQALEHVFYPWKAMYEMYRVLKPGGRLFINVPCWYPEEIDKDVPHSEVASHQHCSILQPFQMRFLFRQCGFRLERQLVQREQQSLSGYKLTYDELANWPADDPLNVSYNQMTAGILEGYCKIGVNNG